MSKSQPRGGTETACSRSTSVALCGTILLMSLLMPASARGFRSDDNVSAGKGAAKKDATNKDNKTTETSNLPEHELLEQLLQQIQLLQARVAELEAKESFARPNQPAPPVAVASPTAAVPTASVPAHPADIEINEVSPRLHLNAYGDVGFAANDRGPARMLLTWGRLICF